MITNTIHLEEINSPRQKIMATVELYRGSTLLTTCSCDDRLVSFTVERTGNNKFFGSVYCQKLTLNLIDIDRTLALQVGDTIKIYFKVPASDTSKAYPFPVFKIREAGEITRDESSNGISISCFDLFADLSNYTIAEVEMETPYTYANLVKAILAKIGISSLSFGANAGATVSLENGANFNGDENLRDVLTALCEATQTVAFMRATLSNDGICFLRAPAKNNVVYTIDKSKYYNLKTYGNAVLGNIWHTTSLGDNLYPSVGVIEDGFIQYVRDNPFWEQMSLDGTLAAHLDTYPAANLGLTLGQYELDWSGNYLLEMGDIIEIEMEDGTILTASLLDDTITFDGTLSQTSRWMYEEGEGEDFANPTSLGDIINQTYARVDKANRDIALVSSQAETNKSNISSLKLTTNTIEATVQETREQMNEEVEAIHESLETLSTQITQSAEEVKIEIKREIEEEGATKLQTGTGYTFNDTGLTIAKSDSEISTTITEDGMSITKNGEEVLRADNAGVSAEDLKATTYLIIGNTSRFESWGDDKTACFWIGGNS